MASRNTSFTATVCALICFSCGQTKQAPAQQAEKTKPVSVSAMEVSKSREANDVARFLAGLKSQAGSPFAEMESADSWKAHAAAFDAEFARYEKTRIPAMKAFQKTELTGVGFDNANLFYPFGGPDFLNAILFFPDRDSYFLVGLEPPGSIPQFKHFAGQDMAAQLPRMRKTLRSLLSLSYFQTQEMAIQVRGQITDGLLPVMLVQMARTGYEVTGWSPVTLNNDGFIVKPDQVSEEPQPAPVPGTKKGPLVPKFPAGVAIEFKKEGTNRLQRLYYFSTNVEDVTITKNKPLLAFLPRMQPMDAMYKAASYLSHRDQFSVIRSKVLDLSQAIIEDDSGIPYRFFEQDKWNLTLYGAYTSPIYIFRTRMQPDLKAAYSSGVVPVKTLDFGIGYSVTKFPSNLLVAKRKSLPESRTAMK